MAATTARGADLHSELTGRILRKRADRTRRILAALGSLAPGIDLPVPEYDPESGPDAFDTALLHHAFQLAQFAVSTRDAALVRRALRLWLERDLIRERALRTAVGPVLVVSAADCLAVDDDRLGNRMYLLADPPSADERDTFSKVIDYLSRVQPAAADTTYLALVLRQRLADERRSLEIGREAANRCFAMVGSEPLRAYLEEAVRRAGTVD